MEKQKRTRRTKRTIEEELFRVVEQLVVQKGFNGVTFSEIAREAKVERRVLYNRFSGLSDLLDKYVQRYDCWLSKSVTFNPNESAVNNIKNLFSDLVNRLYKNQAMQKILIWELNDTSKTTRRLAQKREIDATELLKHFNESTKDFRNGELINEFLSLFTAGIYYLILHRKVSTFGFTDFDTEEGKDILINVIFRIIDCVYPEEESNTGYPAKVIARNLLQKGVDKKIVATSTGLPIAVIEDLGNK